MNAPSPAAGLAGVAAGLCLAAAPAFAAMALVTQFAGDGAADLLCLANHGAGPLNGMATMYLLMSLFHLAPWLRLIARSRRTGRRRLAREGQATGM